MRGKTWAYHNPTDIRFGVGALEKIGELVAGRSYVLVTYGQPAFSLLAKRIVDKAGEPITVIDNIDSNPDYTTLEECCRAYREAGRDAGVIVALGGGSVIDAAKVLAVAGGSFECVKAFLKTGKGADDLASIPIIAVPTTSGTGSEVTRWATVWNTQSRKKFSLNLPNLYPEYALVDPELMVESPRQLTISTGLDALSHALESIWNVNANPVSSVFAVAAATEVLETLQALADDLHNLELRTRMARAALNAGLAFSNTRTALAHSLSYPITLRHGTPHGIACSFSLPMVMRWIIGADRECDKTLSRIFGDNLEAGANRLAAFLKDLGIGIRPEDHGVGAAEWSDIVEQALDGERGRNFLGRPEAVIAKLR